MIFSREGYRKVASVIGKELARINQSDADENAKATGRIVLEGLTGRLADMFADDNESFNRLRFVKFISDVEENVMRGA